MVNNTSLDTLCAALAYAMGIDAPKEATEPTAEMCAYIDQAFGGKKADRIFMYNPDAIGEWIYRKYPQLLQKTIERTDLALPFCTVMPSVTPVCFGTMYTGAQPAVHGIQKYEKPVIAIETIFDALIKAGKKPAIVASNRCSIGKIFLEREMDYFLYDSLGEINAKAIELIMKDEYDFIVVYNGNYDARMHKHGPESVEALAELKVNDETFDMFAALIEKNWENHNTLLGFAMDHGCHEIDGGCGSHGLDMEEDLNAKQIDSYTIGEGYTDQEKLAEFQQLVDQVLADMSIAINNTDDKDDSAKSMALLLGYMVKPVTKLYVFPVTTTVDGETSSSEIAVTCDDQGEWYVNTGIGVVMYEFLEMAQKSAVNSYARSVHHAAEASLIEMDEEGIDLSQFNGDFRFSGEEFENVTEPVTTAPAADVLKYRIALYYMEVSKLDEVMIRIQNGTCMAVAIKTNPENGNRIGTYPVCDDIVDDMPLEEALEQATAIY